MGIGTIPFNHSSRHLYFSECPKGSVVAFDYLTTEFLSSHALYWRYARATTRAAEIRDREHTADERAPRRVAPVLQTLTCHAAHSWARDGKGARMGWRNPCDREVNGAGPGPVGR